MIFVNSLKHSYFKNINSSHDFSKSIKHSYSKTIKNINRRHDFSKFVETQEL